MRTSQHAMDRWSGWASLDDGCDDQGNYIGWCPLHDPNQQELGSAQYNFIKGVMRCTNDPRCTGTKRAVSLTSLGELMLKW